MNSILLPIMIIALSIPLILEWIPRNWFYGLRTRRTLSSDQVWYPANRVGGIALAIAGGVWLIVALTMPKPSVSPIGILAVIVAGTVAIVISTKFSER